VLRPFFLRDHWDADAEPGRLVCGACQHVVLPTDDMPKDPDTFFALPFVHTGERSDWSARQAWLSTERPWMACTSGNMSVSRAAAAGIPPREATLEASWRRSTPSCSRSIPAN
jgi:hypothetical protein